MKSLTQSLLARHTELADASRIALVAAQTAAISFRTHNLPGGPTNAWRLDHTRELAIAAMEAHAEAHIAKEAYLEALAASAQPAALSPAAEAADDSEDTTCTCGDKRGMGTDDDGACRDCGGYA